jgi:hypothetical protein
VLHRYLLAFDAALLAGGLYFYLSGNAASFSDMFEVTSAAGAWVISAFLFVQIVKLKPSQVGALQHEKSSIENYLFLVLLATLLILVLSFLNVAKKPDDRAKADLSWLYGKWGRDRECTVSLAFAPGRNPRELTIISDEGSHPSPIIGEPTSDSVTLPEAQYRLRDGLLTSTEYGMDGVRFHRCG